jgi:hypothetical protein
MTDQKPIDIEKAGSESVASEQIVAPSSSKTSIRDYWIKDVDVKYGDWLLFACCITTGLLDTSTFRNYAAFVSMQTGMKALNDAVADVGKTFD